MMTKPTKILEFHDSVLVFYLMSKNSVNEGRKARGEGGGNCFKDSTLTFLPYCLKPQETLTKVVMIN